MPLHYTKSGALDMRYSSSKAAVASGYSGGSGSAGGYSGGGGGYSGVGTYSGGYSERNSSSSGGYSERRSSSSGGYNGGSVSTSSTDMHFKKDGTLDMRYSSSKVASSLSSSAQTSVGHYADSSPQSGLHYKKDGSLDMRYSSSKGSSSAGQSSQSTNVAHLKKDGSLDMRYNSSRQLSQIHKKLSGLDLGVGSSIPSHVPRTKTGLPDMRTKQGKEWVQLEAQRCLGIPEWIPRKKDGTPDTAKAAVAEFLFQKRNVPKPTLDHHYYRERYYAKKMGDPFSEFRARVLDARKQVRSIPEPSLLPDTQTLREEIHRSTVMANSHESEDFDSIKIPNTVPMLNYEVLKAGISSTELGRGNFGVVLKGKWQGLDVAVKRLHLTRLNRKEKGVFSKELKIMSYLGKHPNLVTLYGYTIEPPCLVMEFVKLGSLCYVLHDCKDATIEADITCGATKKFILLGIVNGIRQLHAVGVVHGDLKPANVLLTEDYTAKITDFGLAILRGKTSSSVASIIEDGENVVGGTGGYMAPELLSSSTRPDFTSDIYSFGILLNEVIQEEEPYSGEFQNFLGRGPFAAVNFARLGNRPFIKPNTPANLQSLIKECWHAVPAKRPTCDEIFADLREYVIPNSC